MNELLIRALTPRDARWCYDDPSGVESAPARPARPVPARRRSRRRSFRPLAFLSQPTPKEA